MQDILTVDAAALNSEDPGVLLAAQGCKFDETPLLYCF